MLNSVNFFPNITSFHLLTIRTNFVDIDIYLVHTEGIKLPFLVQKMVNHLRFIIESEEIYWVT